MRSIRSTVSALSALFLVSGTISCATTTTHLEPPGYLAFAPAAPPRLTHAPASAEASQVVDEFYSRTGAADPTAVIDAALKNAPENPDLHEIAGYLAILRGDADAAFDHFYAVSADLGAVAPELAIWEMSQVAATTTQHLRAKSLLELIVKSHPDQSVRAAAASSLIDEQKLFAEDPQGTIEGLALIKSWRVIGPFDNDQGRGFATEYAPETGFDGDGEIPGLVRPVRYRTLPLAKGDVVLDLDAVHAGEAVAYLETGLVSPAKRQVELRLTTSSPLRVWVNDKLVVSEEKITRAEIDNVVVKVDLEAGQNRILVKSARQFGAWQFTGRVTEVGGATAAGLRAELTPLATPTPLATNRAPLPVSKKVAPKILPGTAWRMLEDLKNPERKNFLLGRLAARQGHTRQPTSYLDPFLAANPKNPLGSYYGALAYLELGESGRALDLLTHGSQSFPYAAAFLLRRGKYYAQKFLLEKARADIQAVLEKTPSSREAALSLGAIDSSSGWTLDRCALLQKILLQRPDDAEALTDLGYCQTERGSYFDADKSFQKARSVMPGYTPALHALLGIARRRPNEAESLELATALRQQSPTNLGWALEEADVLREFGHLKEARARLEEVAANAPDAAKPLERLGDLAFEEKDLGRATALYRSALERDPQDSRLAERLDTLDPSARTLADRLAATDEDIERAIDSAGKISVDPGSHFAVLLDDDVTEVNADGSSKRMVTIVRQALTENGRDAIIQAKLPGFGRVKVLDAYSLKHGGDRQEASSVSNALVRFRSLDIGSIVVLRYVHYSPAGRFPPQ